MFPFDDVIMKIAPNENEIASIWTPKHSSRLDEMKQFSQLEPIFLTRSNFNPNMYK